MCVCANQYCCGLFCTDIKLERERGEMIKRVLVLVLVFVYEVE